MQRDNTAWKVRLSDLVRPKVTPGRNAHLRCKVACRVLGLGAPRVVRDDVEELIDTIGDGGGFIASNGAYVDGAERKHC